MSLDVSLKCEHCGTTFYSSNITHNLNEMAAEAGIYEYLWRPEEVKDVRHAENLIVPLEKGLELLKAEPERFKKFNPENGWGDYDCLVEFVREYLAACKKNKKAIVEVSR